MPVIMLVDALVVALVVVLVVVARLAGGGGQMGMPSNRIDEW